MKKFSLLFLFLLVFVAATMAQNVPYYIVTSGDGVTGTLSRTDTGSTSSWMDKFTYTTTESNAAALTLQATRPDETNRRFDMYALDGGIIIASGAQENATSQGYLTTYTLTVPAPFKIASYSFNIKHTSGACVIAAGSTSLTTTTEKQPFSVSDINSTSTAFTVSGVNNNLEVTDFVVNVCVDYTPYSTGERTATTNETTLLSRKISAINVNGASIAVAEEYRSQRYVDLTSDSFTVQPGAAIKFSVSTVSMVSWMHSYAYIDYDANGFDLTATTERPLGDLVANSYNSSNEGGCFDITGTFNAPATVGEYRMRYKMDWNDTNPAGSQSWENNAGTIIDFTLVVEPEAENAAAKAALKAAIDELDTFLSSIRVGNKVSEYSSSLDDADEMFAGAKAFYGVVDSETAIADIEDCTATVRAIKDSYSENVLEDGKFYYIHSACTNSGYANGYVYASLSDIKYGFAHERNERNGGCWEVTTTPAVKHTWKCEIIDGTAYLKNLHTASYIKGIVTYLPARLSETEKAPITINKLGDGQVNILVNGTQAHAQTGNSEYFFVPWDGEKNSASAWYVEEVSAVPAHTLTVGDAEWSTLVLGYNATIPNVDGFKAYTVSAVGGNYLSLAEAKGVLGANTAIIVNAPAGDYEFAYTAELATVDASTDVLKGSLYDKNITPTDGTAYILSKQDDVVAFYKAKLDVNTDTSTDVAESFMNNANKVYLMLSAAQAMSNSFRLSFIGGTTMVDEVETEDADVKVVYNLQGRVVENPDNGIYIVGGKKVLVK